ALFVPSTLTVYPSGSRLAPVVVVVTFSVRSEERLQFTWNATEVLPPAGTFAVCEVPPLTVQFAATPESVTSWLPEERLANDWLPLSAIDALFVPSTLTVYPSGSRLAPVVVVVTFSVPVVGPLQLTWTATDVLPPAGTLAF